MDGFKSLLIGCDSNIFIATVTRVLRKETRKSIIGMIMVLEPTDTTEAPWTAGDEVLRVKVNGTKIWNMIHPRQTPK